MAPRSSTSPSTQLKKATAFAADGWTRWTDDEIDQIMADGVNDYELAKKFGRSISAIQLKRHRTNRAAGR